MSLIYLKQEKLSDKSSEKNVQFEVFEPYNKTKLNLSLCSQTSINIYVIYELSPETQALNAQLEKLGYNMFDINDPFYQDICTPYKSSVNTDMLLSDRIYYIYNNGNAHCQPNCYFTGYISGSKYINCTCSISEENNVVEEKFRPEKLYESFFEILKYSNYKILKCYKLISSNKIIKENIGSIILIIFFVVYLISLLFYIIKGVNPLKNKIKKLKAKEEENKVYSEEIRINPNIFDNNNKEENNKIEKIIKYPPKKKKSISFKKSTIEVDKKKNIDLSKTQNINSQLR